MKFDVIVGNPPYNGALHQEFFNKAVEKLKPSGAVTFIQPATQYYNKKDNRKQKSTVKMLENVQKYQTRITLLKDSPFEARLALFSGLAITHLRKEASKSGRIQLVSGDTTKTVGLDSINQIGMDPEIYNSLVKKIKRVVKSNGDLTAIASSRGNYDKIGLRFSYIRGGRWDTTQFTFLPKDPSYHTVEKRFFNKAGNDKSRKLLLKSKAEAPGLISYLKTYTARFCLSILKTNANLFHGELKLVPLVDFTQNWDDKKLCKLFGITKEEYVEIERCIPQYYPDVPPIMKGK